MKSYFMAFASILALAACENMTSRATDKRLDTLLTSGLDADKKARLDDRVSKIEGREKVVALVADFNAQDTDPSGGISLTQALDQALEGNIEIGRAAQDINAADVARLSAIFGYLPQVRATINVTTIEQVIVRSDNTVFNAGTAQYGSLDYTLEIEQPLIDLSRIFQIKIANTARSGAEVGYIAAVQKAMFDTFSAYLTASQTQQRKQILLRRASLVSRQISRERSRTDAGLSDPSAVIALQQSYSSLQVDASAAEIAQARALGELMRLTGASITSVLPPQTPSNMRGVERRVSVAQAIDSANENNPNILRSVVEVAEYDQRRLQSISADFSPVLSAFGRLVVEDRDGSRFGGGSETEDTIVGVRMVIPIFNADGQGYRTLTSNVDFKQAVLGYANQKRQISAQIRGVHGQLTSLTKAISGAQSAAQSARKLVRAEKARVDAGTSQDFLVTELESRALAARSIVQEYQVDYFRAWGELQYLSGITLADKL
jgi:outer membrane protein TolC